MGERDLKSEYELVAYGARVVQGTTQAVCLAILEARRLANGDESASRDSMCQHADGVGDDFKFALLDYVDEQIAKRQSSSPSNAGTTG